MVAPAPNNQILTKNTGFGISPENRKKMQGKIYVDSILGQGTVFTVVLKLAKT